MTAPPVARAIFFTNPHGIPYVEHEHNGVDPDQLAEDLAHAGFTDVRVVEAIEDTDHDHGAPLVVLTCPVCKGGNETPVLVCPTCALVAARVAAPKAALVETARRNKAGGRPRPTTKPRPKRRKKR
jgi:hypothetical protein